MTTITRAVGRGVVNPNLNEVSLVQRLLNENRQPPLRKISEDGLVGPETITAIEEFQRRVVKMTRPDGKVDPGGTTLRMLSGSNGPGVSGPSGDFSHPDAGKVHLHYGPNAVRLNSRAEQLLKSILASCSITSATLNSTLRTYHDQARITITQTYKSNPDTVSTWYGKEVLKACEEHLDDIDGFATWWEQYDTKRRKVSSKHLSNHAMDVVPGGDRTKFVAKVKELKAEEPQTHNGVQRIIEKGQMHEPVDHVEFTFEVT